MLTLDVVQLIDRINKLENETKELRGLVKQNRAELDAEIEETRQSVADAVPALKDGKLVIETYDDQGNTVYGHVVAEIKSDEQPSV